MFTASIALARFCTTPAPHLKHASPPTTAPGRRARFAGGGSIPSLPSPTARATVQVVGAARGSAGCSFRSGMLESQSQSPSCELIAAEIGSQGRRAWARILDTAWQQGAADGHGRKSKRPHSHKRCATVRYRGLIASPS